MDYEPLVSVYQATLEDDAGRAIDCQTAHANYCRRKMCLKRYSGSSNKS